MYHDTCCKGALRICSKEFYLVRKFRKSFLDKYMLELATERWVKDSKVWGKSILGTVKTINAFFILIHNRKFSFFKHSLCESLELKEFTKKLMTLEHKNTLWWMGHLGNFFPFNSSSCLTLETILAHTINAFVNLYNGKRVQIKCKIKFQIVYST